MEIGTVRKGNEIGLKGGGGESKFSWLPCSKCGKLRWVAIIKGHPRSQLCQLCGNSRRGKLNPNWKGGRTILLGYIRIRLQPDDFFYPMTTKSTVFEHRLVVAKAIGRNLHRWEIVHHKHTKYPAGSIEDKQDNRIENLQLVSDDRHKQITVLEIQVGRLKAKVLKQAHQIKNLEEKLCQLKKRTL